MVSSPTLVLRLHIHTESGCSVVDQLSLCQLRSVNLTIRLQDPAAICLCLCVCCCICICIIFQCLCQLHTDYLTVTVSIRKMFLNCANCSNPISLHVSIKIYCLVFTRELSKLSESSPYNFSWAQRREQF